MRILIANKFFFRNGGSEVVMFAERDFLLREGHEVVDFSMEDPRNLASPHAAFFVRPQNYRNADGIVRKIRLAAELVHSREAVRKIGALIDFACPDLVHCHNIYHQLTPSIIGAAKSRGVPVVLTLHDYKPICPAYTRLRNGHQCSDCLGGDFSPVLKNRCADGSLARSALLYLESFAQHRMGNYEKVDRYVAPSRFMAESIAHRIAGERVALLYNGVKLPQARDADDGRILYFGRLSPEKGIETLLQAHAATGSRWPLIVVGTGPLHDALASRFPRVHFLGHLSGDDLSREVARAAIVVVPSDWYENCPMSVLEAMAHGKPVVGSRIGGIPELVADGETGLLFEAGDVHELSVAVARLMESPEMRREMGLKARARAERHFSLDVHNRGLLGIYESVLRAPKRV